MTIQAIETVYNGYRFRSRLEARWAVFFDTLGVKYRYEVEGHVLADGTRYLPDFELPQMTVFVEAKGAEPTEQETRKATLLAGGRRGYDAWNRVFMLVGDPWPGEYKLLDFHSQRIPTQFLWYFEQAVQRQDWIVLQHWKSHAPYWYWLELEEKMPEAARHRLASYSSVPAPVVQHCSRWLMCSACGLPHAIPDDTPDNSPRYCGRSGETILSIDDRLKAAFTAARQARFEHGESGPPKALLSPPSAIVAPTMSAQIAAIFNDDEPTEKARRSRPVPPPPPIKRAVPPPPPAPANGKYFSRSAPGAPPLDPTNPLHQLWSLMLDEVRERDPKLAAFLCFGLPIGEQDGRMMVAVDPRYKLHCLMLEEPRVRAIYEPILGMPCQLVIKEGLVS